MICLCILVCVFGSTSQHQNSVFGPHGELLIKRSVQTSSAFKHSIPINHNADSVPDFRPSVQIDDSTLLGCRGPALHVLDNNILYAILQSGPSSSLPRYIRFTISNDTGRTWLKPNIVIRYDPDIIILWPSLAVGQDGSLNVVWTEPYDSGILFSRSVDTGLTWSDTVRVDDDIPAGDRRYHPDITCSGDTLFACWDEGPQSGGSTYYPWVKISTDDGATWFQETQIDCVPPNNPAYTHRPYIRYDPLINRIYVMWGCEDGEIYVARSSDGISWQASIVSIDNIQDARYASIDIGPDGTVYVVWTEARYGQYDTDIFLSKSTDGGVNWSSSVLVNDQAGIGANQYEPHISVNDQSDIHVTWIECIPFGSMTNAYYTVSFDSGSTWFEPNLTVTDIPYTITPSVPYSIAIASDTASFAYIGWCYRFSGTTFNYFSTNCPDEPGIEESTTMYSISSYLEISPNPFSISTNIKLQTSNSGSRITMNIFDVTGRLIKNLLLPSAYSPLPTVISWDGRDNNDSQVPGGVYFVKIEAEANSHSETEKILLIR